MMKNKNLFPLEKLEEIKIKPERFRLIEQIPITYKNTNLPINLSEQVGDERTIIFLDTETTGLDVKNNVIIELGMVKARYSPSTNKLVDIIDIVSFYEEPPEPISEEITKLNGITNEMVKGKRIDDFFVKNWINNKTLIVAHNASFDRKMFDKRFKEINDLPWACSNSDVDWKFFGFRSSSLQNLLFDLGWFYEAHRATTDCLALIWLFHLNQNIFHDFLIKARKKTILIQTYFDYNEQIKLLLKNRGYKWNPELRTWWIEIEINEIELEKEKKYLDELKLKCVKYEKKDAKSRFK